MRIWPIIATICIQLLVLGLIGFLGTADVKTRFTESSFVPHSIEYVERRFGPEGDSEALITRGVRNDGSMVTSRRYTGADGRQHEVRTVIDLAIRSKVTLASETQSLMSEKYSESEIMILADRDSSCSQLPRKDMEVMGYHVHAQEIVSIDEAYWQEIGTMDPEAVREMFVPGPVEDFPENKVRQIDFLAPDMGCALLGSSTVAIAADGSRSLLQELEVTSVHLGEPDPSYFAVPEGYARSSGEEFSAMISHLLGAAAVSPLGSLGLRPLGL